MRTFIACSLAVISLGLGLSYLMVSALFSFAEAFDAFRDLYRHGVAALTFAVDDVLTLICRALARIERNDVWLYPTFLVGTVFYLLYQVLHAVACGAFAQAVQ